MSSQLWLQTNSMDNSGYNLARVYLCNLYICTHACARSMCMYVCMYIYVCVFELTIGIYKNTYTRFTINTHTHV